MENDLNNSRGDLKEKKKNTSNKKYIIVLILIVIVSLLLCFKCTQDTMYSTEFDNPILIDQEKQFDVAVESMISMVNVNYLPYVEMQNDGIHTKVFQVSNIFNNHNPLKFYLYDENNNKIYESVEIPQGYQLSNITLNKALSKGEHNCTIEIHYISPNNTSTKFPMIILAY